MSYWIASQMDLPFNHRRHVRLIVNGVENNTRLSNYGNVATVYMDSQKPDSDFVSQWYPEDDNGELFKIHHWFHDYDWPITTSGQDFATLEAFTNSAGVKQVPRYRWTWKHRAAAESGNDYTNVFKLVDTVNTNDQYYVSEMKSRLDFEEWMHVFAFERVIGNSDCYGRANGHNMYGYRPALADRWKLLLLDIELSLGGIYSSDATNTSLLTGIADPTMNRFVQNPEFQRAYWRGFQEAVNGPMQLTNCGPTAQAIYSLLSGNNQKKASTTSVLGPIDSSTSLTNWLAGRRAYISGELAKRAAPFVITNAATSTQSNVVLGGTAPVEVKFLRLDSRTTNEVVSWPIVTNWNFNVVLTNGPNPLTVKGYDRFTNFLSGDTASITITNTP